MGIFSRKKISLLTEEDKNILKNLQRESYLQEAKELVVKLGVLQARTDYQLKDNQDKPW